MQKFSFERLAIPEVVRATPRRFGDSRGHLVETYAHAAFADAGISTMFVQDNQSVSVHRGTVRGLHFQRPPTAQAKLVRVVAGAIFDVAVDLRKGSSTYGRWCGATLTADGDEQLFIPRGFAHGFCTLAPATVVTYKLDNYYDSAADDGLAWNDPALAVAWPIDGNDVIISDKDRGLPGFVGFDSPF